MRGFLSEDHIDNNGAIGGFLAYTTEQFLFDELQWQHPKWSKAQLWAEVERIIDVRENL